METTPVLLAWESWTEEPSRLQSPHSQGIRLTGKLTPSLLSKSTYTLVKGVTLGVNAEGINRER